MVICCRIFKERASDSPGIILIGHGVKNAMPSDKTARWLDANGWTVVFMNVGLGEARLGWLTYPCCLGGTVLDHGLYESIIHQLDPREKFVLCNGNQDGLSYRTLSAPPKIRGRTNVNFSHLKRPYDICDITTAEDRKRHELFIKICQLGQLKGYLFISAFYLVNGFKERILNICSECGFDLHVFRYPGSDIECFESVNGQLFIDTRTWDENWGSVSNILDSTKVWVHLSHTEGLPESMREALMRDVPVVVASDLRSQIMMGKNRELLFEGKYRIGEVCPPIPEDVVRIVQKIIDNRGDYQPRKGLIASGFDPFELNREITHRCQTVFEYRGWSWIGVSLGVTSGTGYSDIDLEKPITAEILHRGFGTQLWDDNADYENDYKAAFYDV
jgi:hypothetical protein